MNTQGPWRTTDVALVGIFGALIALSFFIPVSIMVGAVGVFNLTWLMQTLAGILLGPYLGGEAAIIGTILGNLINPSVFGPLAFILPVLAAVEAGLIVWSHWRVAAAVLTSLIVVWFILPTGLAAWPMAFFHILGVIIIVSLGRKLPLMIRESTAHSRVFIGWLLTAYCANVTRHMLGNIFGIVILSFAPEVFWGALPFTLGEQAIFASTSAAIGVPTLFAIKNAKLSIPLTRSLEH